MRAWRKWRWFLLFVIVAAAAWLLLYRRFQTSSLDYGPMVALCPGPDGYGYTCEGGAGYAYIDATVDTALYLDDGLVTLDLPFPFTFYGTTYQQVSVSSNGNLQFNTANPAYDNSCLHEAPAALMGDMIAPYWDDLDLTQLGFLEVETVGTAPHRIFVIEWDEVPPYGAPAEALTFEVQLFEDTQNILFLYQDMTPLTGDRGRSATVGWQTAAQVAALQFSCNLPALNAGQTLQLRHPETAHESFVNLNEDTAVLAPAGEDNVDAQLVKGDLQQIMRVLAQDGTSILPDLQRQWLHDPQPRYLRWETADVEPQLPGEELLLIWYGESTSQTASQLAVLGWTSQGELSLIYQQRLTNRHINWSQPEWLLQADFTNNGRPDIFWIDRQEKQLGMLTWQEDIGFTPISLATNCLGTPQILTLDSDRVLSLSDCDTAARDNLFVWFQGQLIPWEMDIEK